MTTCRGCGKPIKWIRTPGGKRMPVDPEQVTYWNTPDGKERIVTPNGEVLPCEIPESKDHLRRVTGIGYIPHWATCPQADKFKKG